MRASKIVIAVAAIALSAFMPLPAAAASRI
jgi:hypothetical protein